MAKIKTDELRAALEEVILKLGLQDETTGEPIAVSSDMTHAAMGTLMTDAIELIDLTHDKFSKATMRVIDSYLTRSSPTTDTPAKADDNGQEKPTATKPKAAPKNKPKPPKTEAKPPRETYTRVDALVAIIVKNPKLKPADAISAADKLYVATTGKASNIDQTKRRYHTVIKVYNLLKG